MDIFSLLMHLLSFWITVGAKLTISPQKLNILRGDKAQFTCSTSSPIWTIMVWMLNGTAVLTISKEAGVLPSVDPNVMAEKIHVSTGDSWMFVLKRTERHNQGQVTCDLQGIDRKTASLFVEEEGSVEVFGDNKLALKGQLVFFECHAEGWYPQPTLQWQLDDKKVSEDAYNISSEESGKSLFTVTSNLSMTAAKSLNVHCLASVSALPTPLKSSIRLTVVAEVVQEGDDCTVPLAVTASLSAFLLLLLLCICAVLWNRQRRQAMPNSQEEIRFDPSVRERCSIAEVTRGKVNLGYSSDSVADTAFNKVTMETGICMDSNSFHKVPDVVSSSSSHTETKAPVCLLEESSKNVRRITTV